MSGYLKAALIALTFMVLNALFLIVSGFLQMKSVSLGFFEAEQTALWAPLNSALAQLASAGVVFLVMFPLDRGDQGFLDAVHMKPLAGGMVALCFAAGVAMQFSLAEVGNLGQEIWPMSFDELARIHEILTPTTLWGGLSALFAFVIVAPVTEELVFRGWILPMLERQYGPRAALIWSSVLFGLVHREPAFILYATLAGFILGAIAIRTKSTLASIAVHAGVNATPLFVPVTLVRIEGFNTLPNDVQHIGLWVVLVSVAATAALLTLIWRATD